MSEISELELSQISAQSGISYVIGNSQLRITYDSYAISDTDSTPHNWMEFNNITIDDGAGGYFSMDTPNYGDNYGGNLNIINWGDFNTIDVATDTRGRTFISMNFSTEVEPRTYTVGDFVFCDVDLGSIKLNDVTRGASDNLIFYPRTGEDVGIDMQYVTELDIDSLQYFYNTDLDFLSLGGIHAAEAASGSPNDPSTWTFSGKFKLGDLANENPVTMDVATWSDGVSTTGTSVFMNVPMSGTMRVEEVQFDGADFGPVAIDGMTVHYLGIMLPGI